MALDISEAVGTYNVDLIAADVHARETCEWPLLSAHLERKRSDQRDRTQCELEGEEVGKSSWTLREREGTDNSLSMRLRRKSITTPRL